MLRENHIDLIVTDLKMPKVDGMTLLREALAAFPELPIVMITAHGTVDTAVEALKLGAFDYLTKPFDKDEVRQIVGKALKTRELAGEEPSPAGAATPPTAEVRGPEGADRERALRIRARRLHGRGHEQAR